MRVVRRSALVVICPFKIDCLFKNDAQRFAYRHAYFLEDRVFSLIFHSADIHQINLFFSFYNGKRP